MSTRMSTAEVADLVARTREQAFDDQVVAVQERLCRLATEIGQLRVRDQFGTDRPAVKRAGEIAHTLTWGLANCDVQLLVTLAAEADAARAASRAASAAADAVAERKAEAAAALCVCCENCGAVGVDRRDHAGTYFCGARCQTAWEGATR